MTIQEIDKIESELDIKLPLSYRDLLSNYPEKLIETDAPDFTLLLDENRIIEETTNARSNFLGKPLKREVIIIGENGCGDYYLMKSNGNGEVLSFFHDNSQFYKVANNLDIYIEKIINGSIEENWSNPEFETEDLRENSNVISKVSKTIEAKEKKKWWKF